MKKLVQILFITVISILSGFAQTEIDMDDFESISFPQGWDDKSIEMLKNGKSQKIIIAIVDFQGSQKLQNKVELKLSDMLLTELSKTNAFQIVERSKLEKVVQEQNLQASGLINENQAVEMGNLLGAEYVVMGNITSASVTQNEKFAYVEVVIEVGVDVKIVEVGSGKIIFTSSSSGQVKDKIIASSTGTVVSSPIDYNLAFTNASRIAIQDVAKKMGDLDFVSGYVVDIKGEKVTVDVGSENGVENGSYFLVFRITKEIIHPVSKKLLGYEKEKVSIVQITAVEKFFSTGRSIVEDNPVIIQPGDMIIQIDRKVIDDL